MARPQKCRRICSGPAYDEFLPNGIPSAGSVILTVDEYEVVRLIDLERKTHEQCALQMEISRTTVTEIYDRARYKIADSMVNGKRLIISGGNYRLCGGPQECGCKAGCGQNRRRKHCSPKKKKGENEMRIAVTYENGNVFQHFGHTEQFKLYDVADNQIVREQVADTMGSGHGALAGFLVENKVDTLICGGIGAGAQNALADAGIRLYGGVAGSADEAVKQLLAGTLGYDPEVHCNHHEQEHSCKGHSCGEDKHGCGGNRTVQ